MSASMLVLVRVDLRGALTLGLLGGIDRGQDLGLIVRREGAPMLHDARQANWLRCRREQI